MTIVSEYVGVFLQGAVVTIELTVAGTVLSLALGIILATIRLYGPGWLKTLIMGYVEIIRGLPPILQLFIIYFGLTQFGVDLDPFTAAIIWLVLYGTGYAVEIFRAGIEGVHFGQTEAAVALGMTRFTMMRRIILPQAAVKMLPPLTSFLILQLKNTTLVFFVGVADIMYQANLGADATSNPGILYPLAALFYLAMNIPLGRFGSYLERRAAAYQ